MIARLAALVSAVLLLGAAAPTWRWSLPMGWAPPSVPADNPMSAAKVALGRRLFYDADLSIDGTMACATCHEQKRAFADGNRTHPGVHGDAARRNVPGLANVAWLPSLTWGDPRVRTLEAQVAIPVSGVHPIEMGMRGREAEIAHRLRADACYRRMFRSAFPATRGRIDYPAVARALAAFERTFVSTAPSVRLSGAADRGKVTFDRACAGCHSGQLLTDGRFHRIVAADTRDPGLGEITGKAGDFGRFRTPSLANVAVTGPWLHDGRADTLGLAIAAHGLPLTGTDISDLTQYLKTLADHAFLTNPALGYPDDACRASGGRRPRQSP